MPDYVEISIYRALIESAAGFFGAQMTAMRNASENAGEIIRSTLQMNRARQAEITQEIMEVVAGAEGFELVTVGIVVRYLSRRVIGRNLKFAIGLPSYAQ